MSEVLFAISQMPAQSYVYFLIHRTFMTFSNSTEGLLTEDELSIIS